ncbi:hypothetical protein SAMN02982989_0933 [Xaviernesmea oryzae]|uniref:Uncharacterized protein n=1 Tax=Xaviernesmea oryzae TaxID=464029 RepID=A0A1X7FVJ5_9HYPH|nr:hypothetical protein SAMN02982989_0933 [Xaviernesmea oryzae]
MSSMSRHFLHNSYDIVAPRAVTGLSFALLVFMVVEGWLW